MTKEGKQKKAKKEKKEKHTAGSPEEPTENGAIVPNGVAEPPEKKGKTKDLLIPIASPLADEKMAKRVLRVAKKAAKRKLIRRGVKEVVKALRKGSKGYCIIAGDVTPLDVITHLPVLCEEKQVPYIFVRSKEELGAAGLTKRPTSCMLVLPGSTDAADEESVEYRAAFGEVVQKVKTVQIIF